MNKEIEELLNNIKEQLIIDEKLGKEIAQDFHKTILNYEETKLLLSHIEQLEKENKILRENAEHNDKVVDKVNWENQQLKKQKDDVVEYIKTHDLFDRYYDDKKAKNDLLRMLGEIDD